jgi:hypothetical protein
MAEAFRKLGQAEFSATMAASSDGETWSRGGFMRRVYPDVYEAPEPKSRLQRAATIAMDVAMYGESMRTGSDVVEVADRNVLVDVMSAAVRYVPSALSSEGLDPDMPDRDLARQVLIAMASVAVARDHVDGFETTPLDNPALEAMRRHAGIDASRLSGKESYAVSTGMLDIVSSQDGVAMLRGAMERASVPTAHDWVEAELGWLDVSRAKTAAVSAPTVAKTSFVSPARGPAQVVAAISPSRSVGRD